MKRAIDYLHTYAIIYVKIIPLHALTSVVVTRASSTARVLPPCPTSLRSKLKILAYNKKNTHTYVHTYYVHPYTFFFLTHTDIRSHITEIFDVT